jgi:hypothetical protein
MRKGYHQKLMWKCGRLKSEGMSFKDVQREVGHIGYKTVRRYCRQYDALVKEMQAFLFARLWNQTLATNEQAPQILVTAH